MSDGLFHIIDDGFVILHCRGVYRQAKLYHRACVLYAGYGSGFVRLMQSGTSAPNVNWSDIITPPGKKITKGKRSEPIMVDNVYTAY